MVDREEAFVVLRLVAVDASWIPPSVAARACSKDILRGLELGLLVLLLLAGANEVGVKEAQL